MPKGFTLVETIVYLALFAIIVGGAVASAYSLSESAQRTSTEAMLEAEGDFLVAKIDWALSGAEFFNVPAARTSGAMLSVSKWVPTSGRNPIVFSLSGNTLQISEGGAPNEILNNSNTSVSNLRFTHAAGGQYDAEGISAAFTLSAKTPNGMSVSKTFSTVGYLQK